jgi:hypothetical protein
VENYVAETQKEPPQDEVKVAEANLAALETPKQRFEHAKIDLAGLKKSAEGVTNPTIAAKFAEMIAIAEKEVDEAKTDYIAHRGEFDDEETGGSLDRSVDEAAQAVLDARGEAHTDQDFKKGDANAE